VKSVRLEGRHARQGHASRDKIFAEEQAIWRQEGKAQERGQASLNLDGPDDRTNRCSQGRKAVYKSVEGSKEEEVTVASHAQTEEESACEDRKDPEMRKLDSGPG
jgi:hypothetical protein